MSKIIIPVLEPSLGKEEIKNVLTALKSGWISSKGEYISYFEKDFAKYLGAKYGVTVCNGTAALHLALTALGIKYGDEVIVPNLTFIATPNAVKYCGAKPVLVDVAQNSWCINPNKIEEKITNNTKAIIVVHLYGYACDMKAILKIAKKHNLYVVEDCAESLGAEYHGKKLGVFGDIGCFSFYGNKVITTGEGGMCVTNSRNLSEKMKILRDHGMNPQKKYWHDIVGFNYRMTNIEAAIGLAQIKKINNFISKKRQINEWYKQNLKSILDKKLISFINEDANTKSVFWLNVFLIEKKFGLVSWVLAEKLMKRGIETRPVFFPIHIMPPYKKKDENFIVSKILQEKGLCLPSSVNLTQKQVIYICDEIKKLLKNNG